MDFRTKLEKERDDFIFPLGKQHLLKVSKNKEYALLSEYTEEWNNFIFIDIEWLTKNNYDYYFTIGRTAIFKIAHKKT